MRLKLTALRFCVLFIFLLFSNFIFAQQKTISGKVTDPTGNAVVGSTVSVKGSRQATQTGSDGSFTISVPPSAKTLIISSVGFESRDISISGQSQVSVVLNTSSSNLNEVVVVGYGTQRRKDLSGSVSSVSAATIEKSPLFQQSRLYKDVRQVFRLPIMTAPRAVI